MATEFDIGAELERRLNQQLWNDVMLRLLADIEKEDMRKKPKKPKY